MTSDTQIKFIVPHNLGAGAYNGFVQVIDVGLFGMFNLNVAFSITSITPF